MMRSRLQDWISALLGFWVALSPITLGHSGSDNAIVSGILILGASLWASVQPRSRVAEWTILVLGLWLFLSPWVVADVVHSDAVARWNAWIVGIVVAVLGTWSLRHMRVESEAQSFAR